MKKMYPPISDCVKNIFRPIKRRALLSFYSNDLVKLAVLCGTDKWNSHWYAQHYQRHFSSGREKKIKLLEIGVGGYEDPRSGGNSLRMWKAYFPNGSIYSGNKKLFPQTFGCPFDSLLALRARRSLRIIQKFGVRNFNQ